MPEHLETAGPPPGPLGDMEPAIRRMVLRAASPGKHCARSALRHIDIAWAIRTIDPDMSAFRAIIGEEEAATAIFHALKRRGYEGAKKLKPENHLHKAAVVPFLQAAGDCLTTAITAMRRSFNIRWDPDHPKGKLELTLRPLDPTANDEIFSALPLHFDLKLDGVAYDFTAELNKMVSAHRQKSIHKLIRARAERRYRILYASPQGVPRINLPVEGPLTISRDRILAALTVFLFIDQHAAVQLLPQQALTAFLALLPTLDPSLNDPGPRRSNGLR